MLCIDIKLTQQFIEPSICSLQSMSENHLVYHEQFILKIGAPRRMPFLLWRNSEGYWDLLVIWAIGMSLHLEKGFVTIQAMPHWNVCVGSWSYFKKYNNIPSFHIYRFIIKVTRSATFLRFAHLYTKYVQFMSKVCVFCSQSGSENPIASDILNKSWFVSTCCTLTVHCIYIPIVFM